MTMDGQATIIGALRIVNEVDSIGIAVFGRIGGNTAFIPMTDTDFRITNFEMFHNTEGYEIDYNLPTDWQSKIYTIGEPAPIPFWIDSFCQIIEGDAESNDIFKRFNKLALHNDVLIDLRRLLADARNGVFREQQEQWTVNDIAVAFNDVLREPPIHSRYWVTRLGEAVRYARSLTRPSHPIDDELRRSALEWIERFATKTDLERLMAVIGSLREGSITSERARSMGFAYLINKAHCGDFNQIEKRIVASKQFRELFPEGIYNYWWRYNWPFLTFDYSRPRDIMHPLIKEITDGSRRENFIRAERMAYLYFVREDAPREVGDIVYPLINDYIEALNNARYSAEDIFEDRSRNNEWRDRAKRVLYFYHILMALEGILVGELRLSRTTVDRRFGLDTFYVKQLEDLAGI